MTRRDLFWRGVGAALFVGGPSALLLPGDAAGLHGIITLVGMAATILGLVFIVQGKKVALAVRVENSPHRLLPSLIRSRRRERRMRRWR